MGKQSRLKAERRARRESYKERVEAWSKIPVDALSGSCRDPACQLPSCLDPHVTVAEIEGADYSGPLVVVTYTSEDHTTRVRINGDKRFTVPHVDAPPDEMDAWRDGIIERFGTLAFDAVMDHFQRRWGMMERPDSA